MTTAPRRRVIRPIPAPTESDRRIQQAFQRSEAKLDKERAAFSRWLGRLKRALRAVDKHLSTIGRLEKALSSLRQV